MAGEEDERDGDGNGMSYFVTRKSPWVAFACVLSLFAAIAKLYLAGHVCMYVRA
jgi:hypothetical protein